MKKIRKMFKITKKLLIVYFLNNKIKYLYKNKIKKVNICSKKLL